MQTVVPPGNIIGKSGQPMRFSSAPRDLLTNQIAWNEQFYRFGNEMTVFLAGKAKNADRRRGRQRFPLTGLRRDWQSEEPWLSHFIERRRSE